MLLDQINLNYLRIFEAVYRTRSMTQAATEMHLTQSGISQHIKSLEETLNIKLFDRIKQKLVPTDEGNRLYGQLAPNLTQLEEILLNVTNKENTLRGTVTIGMPVVFGLNLVMPQLTKFGHENPSVQFNINLDLAPNFNRQLLQGDVDFAFVDEFRLDSQIKTESVYDETLQLCCAQSYIKEKGEGSGKKYFESLEYICYDSSAPLIHKWLSHHFRYSGGDFNIRAKIGDALGVAKLITSGLGVGVLPRHQVMKLIDDGHNIYIFEGKNSKLLTNKISVAYVVGRSWSTAVQETFNYITQALQIK